MGSGIGKPSDISKQAGWVTQRHRCRHILAEGNKVRAAKALCEWRAYTVFNLRSSRCGTDGQIPQRSSGSMRHSSSTCHAGTRSAAGG